MDSQNIEQLLNDFDESHLGPNYVQLQEQLKDALQKLTFQISEKELLLDENKSLRDNIESLEIKIDDLNKKSENLKKDLNITNKELVDCQESLETIKEQNQNLNKELESVKKYQNELENSKIVDLEERLQKSIEKSNYHENNNKILIDKIQYYTQRNKEVLKNSII